MHSSTVRENRIITNAYNIKFFLRLLYNLVVYIYLVDIIPSLEALKKHIMAVVIQRLSERTLSIQAEESIIVTSSSDSEDSCSSLEAAPEIKRGVDGFRLSFGKVAQKRNITEEDETDEQPPRGAKSPSIMTSHSSPMLLLPSDKSSDSVLSDSAKKIVSCINGRSDFKLKLSSTTRPASKIPKDETRCQQQTTCPPDSKTSSISSTDLAERLPSNDLLVLDCRSFMKFNSNHILGSINACCTNPTIKKRFSDGKIGVMELISGAENKSKFQEVVTSQSCSVVIYDDESSNLKESCGLSMIASRLSSLNVKVKFLEGGLKEFIGQHPDLCSQPITIEPRPLLYSPTSPYIDAAIDSTVMTEILPHLCLGNEKDASNMDRLEEARITHVLNVSTSIPLFCDLHRQGSFKSLRLPATDSGSQNIKQYFEQAIEFIDSALQIGGKVLVHCQAGVSRSPTITMAYLMAKFGHTSLEAFGIIKSKRAIISPNINFMGQLLEFESRLKQFLSSDGKTVEEKKED